MKQTWGIFPGVVGIGDTSVASFPTDHPRISLPAELPIHHPAFRVDRANFNAAQETPRKKGIEFEFQDHRISHSLDFYDPDGISSNLPPMNYQTEANSNRVILQEMPSQTRISQLYNPHRLI